MEELFERELVDREKAVKGEELLRRQAYSEIAEREEEMRRRGLSKEEMGEREEFARSRNRQMMNETAARTGSLVRLVEGEEAEKRAVRVRREVEVELNLKGALARNPLPVFLIAEGNRRAWKEFGFFASNAVTQNPKKEVSRAKLKKAVGRALNLPDFVVGKKPENPYVVFSPAAAARLAEELRKAA